MAKQNSRFLALIGQQAGEPGRATKYDPETHCQLIRDLAQAGEFPEAWAAEIGITVNTMRMWVRTHPEFAEAAIIARHLLQAYWSREIDKNRNNPNAKPGLYTLITRRFPELYGQTPFNIWAYLHGQDDLAPPPATSASAPAGSGAPAAALNTEQDILNRLEALKARRREEEGP